MKQTQERVEHRAEHLAGVIGGLVSFGIIGLFVGPVILAVTYRLLGAWIADIDRPPGEVPGSAVPAAPAPPPEAGTPRV